MKKAIMAIIAVLTVALVLSSCAVKLEEGEVMYRGYASFPDVESMEVSFVLTADKSEIRGVHVKFSGLDFTVESQPGYHGTLIRNNVSENMTFGNRYPVVNGKVEATLANSGTLTMTIDDDAAGTLDYIYFEMNAYTPSNSSMKEDLLYPLGTSEITFNAVRGDGE
jgi:hypothetical protein